MTESTTSRLDEIDRAINDLGYGTPEYHEAVAFLCMTLARSQWRLADRARARQQQRKSRSSS